jgi:hypothetical protein
LWRAWLLSNVATVKIKMEISLNAYSKLRLNWLEFEL